MIIIFIIIIIIIIMIRKEVNQKSTSVYTINLKGGDRGTAKKGGESKNCLESILSQRSFMFDNISSVHLVGN